MISEAPGLIQRILGRRTGRRCGQRDARGASGRCFRCRRAGAIAIYAASRRTIDAPTLSARCRESRKHTTRPRAIEIAFFVACRCRSARQACLFVYFSTTQRGRTRVALFFFLLSFLPTLPSSFLFPRVLAFYTVRDRSITGIRQPFVRHSPRSRRATDLAVSIRLNRRASERRGIERRIRRGAYNPRRITAIRKTVRMKLNRRGEPRLTTRGERDIFARLRAKIKARPSTRSPRDCFPQRVLIRSTFT